MTVAILAPDVGAARALVDALAARGAPAHVHTPEALQLDTAVRRLDVRVVVNLVGRATAAQTLFVAEYLSWLADIEVPVVNGLDAFVVASSRTRQGALLDHLGLPHPPWVSTLAPGGIAVSEEPVEIADVARLAFVGGAHAGAVRVDTGAAVTADPGLVRLAAQAIKTAGIEIGGITVGLDHAAGRAVWLSLDIALGDLAGPAADQILRRVR